MSHEDGAYASLVLTAVRRSPSQRPGVRDKAPTARVVTLRIADFLSVHSDAHRLCAVTASGRRCAGARGPAARERAERVDPSSELGRARETVAADQQPQGHEARCWSRPRPAKSGSSSRQPCGRRVQARAREGGFLSGRATEILSKSTSADGQSVPASGSPIARGRAEGHRREEASPLLHASPPPFVRSQLASAGALRPAAPRSGARKCGLSRQGRGR